MNAKYYVSLKAARLLKEKGYNEKCTFAYTDISNGSDINGRIVFNSNDYPVGIYPYPTKAEVIDWLESKGIIVIVYYYKGEWLHLFIPLLSEIEDKLIKKVFIRESFTTRLEAEEAAIIKALELL